MVISGHPVVTDGVLGGPTAKPTHVAFLPDDHNQVVAEFARRLSQEFLSQGHVVTDRPDANTKLVVTSGRFGEPLPWRDAPLFSVRARYKLSHNPVVYALVHASQSQFRETWDRLEIALKRDDPDPDDYGFIGLSDTAYKVLHAQGRRGGPILAMERAIQGQIKSIRVLLLVGDQQPESVFHFDLAGAHPQSTGSYEEIISDVVLRMITTARTDVVAEHQAVGDPIPTSTWERLAAPKDIASASTQLHQREFFTEPLVIAELVKVPVVSRVIAAQYSEGCMATWDPALSELVATVTGSIRPVHKGYVTTKDLTVITGVRSDGVGALYRPIEALPHNLPSSEGIELVGMDELLPRISPPGVSGGEAPVLRSKLHGHRGIRSFDPELVEFVPLDGPFYDYLVSCATDAQAAGVKEAFARSESLRDPGDPRSIVFTVLPGHGIMVAEKWVEGKAPFQVIWEAMDAGALDVVSRVPQGRLWFVEDGSNMVLEEPETGKISV